MSDVITGKRKRGRPSKADIAAREAQVINEAPMTKSKKRQAIFLEQIQSGILPDDAKVIAGYSRNTNVMQIAKSSVIRRGIAQALESRGVTDSYLADRIKEGIEAREDHLDPASQPRYADRHKYIETSLKLRGDLDTVTETQADSWESMLLGIESTSSIDNDTTNLIDINPECDASDSSDK